MGPNQGDSRFCKRIHRQRLLAIPETMPKPRVSAPNYIINLLLKYI
jgi:hypothetical protein